MISVNAFTIKDPFAGSKLDMQKCSRIGVFVCLGTGLESLLPLPMSVPEEAFGSECPQLH